MHLSRFSKEANEMAAHWEMMWRRRITIEAPRELKKALKVAA
jgi:hypothetical protein